MFDKNKRKKIYLIHMKNKLDKPVKFYWGLNNWIESSSLDKKNRESIGLFSYAEIEKAIKRIIMLKNKLGTENMIAGFTIKEDPAALVNYKNNNIKRNWMVQMYVLHEFEPSGLEHVDLKEALGKIKLYCRTYELHYS